MAMTSDAILMDAADAPARVTRGALELVFIIAVITFTGILVRLGWFETHDLKTFWLVLYVIGFIDVIRRAHQGRIFDPLFLLPASYLFLVVSGTVLFDVIRGRAYEPYPTNLVGVGYVAITTGLLLATRFRFQLYSGQPERPRKQVHTNRSTWVVWTWLIIGFTACLVMFAKFGGIPLLAGNANAAKVDFLSGNGYLYIFFIGLTVQSVALLYDGLVRDDEILVRRTHFIAIGILLLLVLTGYRGRTLIFFAEYVGTYLYFRRRRISLKLIGGGLAAVMLFLGVIGAFRRGDDTTSGVFKELGIIITARPVMLVLILRNFDSSKYFYGTRYFGDLAKLLPGSQVGANVDLKYEIFPNADKMPELAGVTPSIIGEAFMNFGPDGVFWVPLFVAFLLGASYKYMDRNPSFMRTSFYLTLAFGLAGAVQSGIGTKILHLVYLWFWTVMVGFVYERRIRT